MLSLQQQCVLFLTRNPVLINFQVLPKELIDEIMNAIRNPYYGTPHVAIRKVISSEVYFTECLFLNCPTHPLLEYIDRQHSQYAYYTLCNMNQGVNLTEKGTPCLLGVIYDSTRNIYVDINENNKSAIFLKTTELQFPFPELEIGYATSFDFMLFREDLFSPEFLEIAEKEGVLSKRILLPRQCLDS